MQHDNHFLLHLLHTVSSACSVGCNLSWPKDCENASMALIAGPVNETAQIHHPSSKPGAGRDTGPARLILTSNYKLTVHMG